jgi:hypothetical protein
MSTGSKDGFSTNFVVVHAVERRLWSAECANLDAYRNTDCLANGYQHGYRDSDSTNGDADSHTEHHADSDNHIHRDADPDAFQYTRANHQLFPG